MAKAWGWAGEVWSSVGKTGRWASVPSATVCVQGQEGLWQGREGCVGEQRLAGLLWETWEEWLAGVEGGEFSTLQILTYSCSICNRRRLLSLGVHSNWTELGYD